MEDINKSYINARRQSAEDEMYRMRERAVPPMPSFVQRPNNRQTEHPPVNSEPHHKETAVTNGQGKKGIFTKDILKFLDFKNLDLDSDRMLILLLILLLSGENSDEILLFALAYIML